MGNEAPEAAGRSEVMLSVAYDKEDCGRVCLCNRYITCKHGSAEYRLVSVFGVSVLLVCFLTSACLFSPLI